MAWKTPIQWPAALKSRLRSAPLYDARQQINDRRAEYAPALYRLQYTDEYWDNLKPKVQDALADTEQADITQTALELKNLEVAYETTLATAAQIIQPSLDGFSAIR